MVAVLQSDGLVLRPWRSADAAALAPACGDPDICRFTTVPREYTLAGACAWVAAQHERNRRGTAVVLAIEPDPTGTPVGMIGLFGFRGDRGVRLGYWLARENRGQGLATKAARALADWAFERRLVDCLIIEVERQNIGSRHIAERLGARCVGTESVQLADGRIVALDRFLIDDRGRAPLR